MVDEQESVDEVITDYTDISNHFLDADLSILGEPLPIYKSYAARIRQEYSHVPHDVYIV